MHLPTHPQNARRLDIRSGDIATDSYLEDIFTDKCRRVRAGCPQGMPKRGRVQGQGAGAGSSTMA